MATLGIPCTTCASKSIGIFKCQGCANVFCRKHAGEHRDNLSNQLDELVNEHNQLYQIVSQETRENHSIMSKLDQWEQNSISRIRQSAQKIREEIVQYLTSHKEFASETLKQISERLRKAREDDDFVEKDLHLWTLQLENLRKELTTAVSSMTLREESQDALVNNIYLSSITQHLYVNDSFLRSVGDIDIADNGQLAIHGDKKRSDAFLCGKNEYSKGKHKIRFIINKKNSNYITTFGIASIDSQLAVYGWSSDDQIVGVGYGSAKSSYNQRDMKGETILQIELTIDCDKRKISYFNERTRCIKEVYVDLNMCPFPWQLYFYLYDIGDRVRLLPSNRL